MNLTNSQKREYLELLFSESREAAQQFLNMLINQAWLETLSLEIKLAIFKFIVSFEKGHKFTVEGYKMMKDCTSCCSGEDFGLCLEEARVPIQNMAAKND